MSDRAGSRRIAATVIRIAAGTKNRPIEAAATTQHANSRTAAMIHAPRRGTRMGISARTTGTDTTKRIHEPLTESPVADPQLVPPASVEHEV